MVFCKGKTFSINAVINLFNRYASCSGQVINPTKSIFFSGSMSTQRQAFIANLLGFSVGSLPISYLGAPIFKGKPKIIHFQAIEDTIWLKLYALKASLLFIAGRVQLVKSVNQNMLLHTILIYFRLVALIKESERWIMNFIWSGDVMQRKLVTVSWAKCCQPLCEGGLSLRSISALNEAAKLKLFGICFQLKGTMRWPVEVQSS